MTLGEFKAWLAGYMETIGGPPNDDQWKRIKEQLALTGVNTQRPPNNYLGQINQAQLNNYPSA